MSSTITLAFRTTWCSQNWLKCSCLSPTTQLPHFLVTHSPFYSRHFCFSHSWFSSGGCSRNHGSIRWNEMRTTQFPPRTTTAWNHLDNCLLRQDWVLEVASGIHWLTRRWPAQLCQHTNWPISHTNARFMPSGNQLKWCILPETETHSEDCLWKCLQPKIIMKSLQECFHLLSV